MDRDLSPRQRRERWLPFARRSILAAALIVAVGWAGQVYLRPSVNGAALRVATVERGLLEASIGATGTVVPRIEQTLSSPISAEILEVHASLGERVVRGQPLLELDTTAAALALSGLEEQIALKQAELRSRELQLSDSIRQTRSRLELLGIDLQSRRARLGRLEKLGEAGAISADELLEAELNVKRTEVERVQTEAELLSLDAQREAELERLGLELSMLDRQRADQARRVEMATVSARFDGIVTYLLQETGVAVTEGQALATVADAAAFAVEATLSDFYAPQLHPQQRVKVRSAYGHLLGRLSRIVAVPGEPRLVLFVTLDNPSAPDLRPNLRVDLDVITAEKPDVLLIRRGPAVEAAGLQTLFVVAGDRALARSVRLGASGPQIVEIVEGLSAGESVIISDMSAFQRVSEVRIR